MRLFATNEEKQKERDDAARIEAAQRDLEGKIRRLDRFTGSLDEYNGLMGAQYEIMDTLRTCKYVYVDTNRERGLVAQLIRDGCSGLVRYSPREYTYAGNFVGGHGIPVRRK